MVTRRGSSAPPLRASAHLELGLSELALQSFSAANQDFEQAISLAGEGRGARVDDDDSTE